MTFVAVDGVDYVSRVQFETRNGETIVIGQSSQTTDRWGTLSDNGECLTGIYGVFTQLTDNTQRVDSIGFYFGRTDADTSSSDGGTFLYTTIVFAVVAFLMGGGLVYVCCCMPSRVSAIGA